MITRITPYRLPMLNYYSGYKANNNKIAFGEFKILSIDDQYKSEQEDIQKKAEDFIEKGEGGRFLGQGLCSKVYDLLKLDGIVIKESMGTDNFAAEETAMKNLPKVLSGSQKFIARGYDDELKEYFILSTKVKGISPAPYNNPWTERHLKKLFDGMFEMDKEGFYHGDLNNGNIKIEENGNVNFIDYQWATKTSKCNYFADHPQENLPRFIPVQNAQMFEMAELPYYLVKMENPKEAKSFLNLYLKVKSDYHQKRVDFMTELKRNWTKSYEKPYIQKAIDFEKAQATIYKKPDDNILKIETLKIQFLNSFREAYRQIDPNVKNKNILSAGSAYLNAISKVQDFRREISKQLVQKQHNSNDSTVKTYLRAQQKYGDYWFENLTETAHHAFQFPYRHAQNKLLDWENERHNFNNPYVDVEQFKSMPDVVCAVDKNFAAEYTRNFDFTSSCNKALIDKIGNLTKKQISVNTSIHGVTACQRNVQKAYEFLSKAYKSSYGLDVINTSLLLTLRANQLKAKISEQQLYGDEHEKLQQLYQQADILQNSAAKLSEEVFNNIYDDILASPVPVGYKNMENFKIT